jgi:hypothetical protein
MAAYQSWAIEAPAVDHTASFEIEEAVSAHVALDGRQLHSSGLPDGDVFSVPHHLRGD